MPPDAVLLLDSSRIAVPPLSGRSFHYKPLASQGDSETGELIGEYTLEASVGQCLTKDQVEVELFEDQTIADLALAPRNADGLVEARPETLLYAAESCYWLEPIWSDRKTIIQELKRGGWAVLRTDGDGGELRSIAEQMTKHELEILHEGDVHKFSFALVRANKIK